MNECSEFGQVCEHGCENIDGTYRCVCPVGFRLHANKQNCIGKVINKFQLELQESSVMVGGFVGEYMAVRTL